MKAKVRLELPPGAVVDDGVRAALVRGLAAQLGVPLAPAHDHDCDLEKSERDRKLPHRAVQGWIEESSGVYRAMMDQMLDEIVAVLAEEG